MKATGTEVFWSDYSNEIGKNVNFGNQLPLSLFKDENGNSYQEISNIQNELTLIDPLIPSMYEKREIIKFVVDFSGCENYLGEGKYDVILGLHDLKENGESEFYINRSANTIQIEDRKYNTSISTLNSSYMQNGDIKLLGNLTFDKLSTLNTQDIGKSIVTRITLLDEYGNVVKYPVGTVATINGIKYIPDETNLIGTVVNTLTQNSLTRNINVSIDMTKVQEEEQLPKGKYIVSVEFYLAKNGILLGKNAILSKEISFELLKNDGYGIKISPKNTNSEDEDKLQLIVSNQDEIKTVDIQYEKGYLDDNSYIQIKTYKRLEDGSFDYKEIESTLAITQKITNLSSSMTSDLIFDKSLENGTYKMVYELCNGEGQVITKTDINYIVNR